MSRQHLSPPLLLSHLNGAALQAVAVGAHQSLLSIFYGLINHDPMPSTAAITVVLYLLTDEGTAQLRCGAAAMQSPFYAGEQRPSKGRAISFCHCPKLVQSHAFRRM